MSNCNPLSQFARRNGLRLFLVLLCAWGPTVSGATMAFQGADAINLDQTDLGSPFPSEATVTGISGIVVDVAVKLEGFSHSIPEDLQLLLADPQGNSVILMTGAGGGADVSALSITFSDSAAGEIPANSEIVDGTYKPTDHLSLQEFPYPGPNPPYGNSMSVFNHLNPNGKWSLYAANLNYGGPGEIESWSITFTIAEAPTIDEIMTANVSTIADPSDNNFDPWIEIYNPNDFDLNITGWKLGNQSQEAWYFPSNTVISAKDFLLVWMDGDDQIAGHPSFAIYPEDGYLSLTTPTESAEHGRSYEELAPDQSIGAFPQGSKDFYKMDSPTPASPNILSPVITSSPQSQTVTAGQGLDVVFCVGAVGSGNLIYQWRKNGINIPAETNSCYTNFNVQVPDGGSYTALVIGSQGTVLTSPALLTLNAANNPGSDFFGNATSLGNFQTFQGDNSNASRQAGEPLHAGRIGSNSVWYTFQPSSDGIFRIDTEGSTFDTLLACYTGSAISNLTEIASDDDGAGGHVSTIRFNMTKGTDYLIALDGRDNESGIYVINWGFQQSSVQVPVILTQPVSQSVLQGDNVQFTVAGSGPPSLTYQWMLNGNDLLGETNLKLDVLNVSPADVGLYSVRISTPNQQTATSAAASLQIGTDTRVLAVNKFADLFPPPDGVGAGGGLAGQFLRGSDGNGGGADAGIGASFSIGSGSIGSHVYSNERSDTDAGEIPSCGIRGGASDWFELRMTNNATCVIDTSGSSIPTVIAVFEKARTIFGLVGREIACNNGSAAGLPYSQVRFEGVAGQDYLIAVDGATDARGIIHMGWQVGRTPVITNSATAGYLKLLHAPLTLNALPDTDRFPLSYRWLVNGTVIPGGHHQTLFLPNLERANVGRYELVTTNIFGATRSQIAEVGVINIRTGPGGANVSLQIDALPGSVIESSLTLSSRDWFPILTIPPAGNVTITRPISPRELYRLRR